MKTPIRIASVLLLWLAVSGSAGAAITNPSFEDDGENFFFTLSRFPIGWGGAPGGGGHKGMVTNFAATEGSYLAQLFIAASGAAPGADQFPVRLTQSVDLTGVDALTFDVNMTPESGWNPAIVAEFRVGGSVEWSRTSGGVLLDEIVDVSAYSGVHEIEFRLTATISGAGTGGHNFRIDNLRETTPPPRLTSARVDPHVIRAGVDTFTMTVTTSDPTVSEVHIDLGSTITQDGMPAGNVVFRDDGTNGDVTASDGVYTADGIALDSVPTWLDFELVGVRDIDYLFPAAPTVETLEDLALGLRSMNPSVPVPQVTDYAADVRASTHAVSMSTPIFGAFPEHWVDTLAISQRQYDFFPDDIDFLMLSHDYPNNVAAGTFGMVRNDVVGTGEPIVDDSANYGSSGALRGRVDVYYGRANALWLWNHEILHYWAAHLDGGLNLGSGHWEVIEGATTGFGTAGPSTVYDRIELVSGNTYQGLDYPSASEGAFNELELYLMGLLPGSSVPSPIDTLINPVFQGTGADVCDPTCATSTLYTADGIQSVTVTDIENANGVRSPAYPASPQHFKGRLVVVFDRVLTDVELAYYDAAMREYEQASSPHGMTFAAATDGTGTLTLGIGGSPVPSISSGGLMLLAGLLAFGPGWLGRKRSLR